MKKTEAQANREIVEHIIFVAECYGWKKIEHLEKEKIIACRREGVRINIWYERMTVGTAMDHPRQGSTQMIRKRVSMEMLEQLLDNPRLHTSVGYLLKKGRNWGKTYRHHAKGKSLKRKTFMKQSGLRNRFSQATRQIWLYWYDCMICGMNQIDTLHHMISPSVRHYVDGKHNESVFNSCPIHNMKHPSARGEVQNCHIGNEAYLYSDEGVKYLLNKVARALFDDIQYQPKEIDLEFIRIYKHLYESDIIKRSKINS